MKEGRPPESSREESKRHQFCVVLESDNKGQEPISKRTKKDEDATTTTASTTTTTTKNTGTLSFLDFNSLQNSDKTQMAKVGNVSQIQNKSANKKLSKAPKYGEQSYWEERYQHFNQQKIKIENGTDQDRDEPLPYHSWYFTYNELRPLIMPLIIGGRYQPQELLEESSTVGEDKANEDEQDQQNSNIDGENGSGLREHDQKNGDSLSLGNEGGMNRQAAQKISQETWELENHDADEEQEDEMVQVIDSEEEEVGDSDDEGDSIDRGEGLAAGGPIRILEIGCGDVPLGVGLAQELCELQTTTGALASHIAKHILCTDYSPAVIKQMQQVHGDKTYHGPPLLSSTTDQPQTFVPLEFLVVDARKLPLDNDSVSLILEKGTLDAMMSDPDLGIHNCQQTLRECARVLVVGGCMLLISHWNAHTEYGMQWLHDVVFQALMTTANTSSEQMTTPANTENNNYHWEIEVHGKDEAGTLGEDECSTSPVGGPGPAVYIVHKRAKGPPGTEETKNSQETSQKNANQPGRLETIPVRFYSY